MGRSFLHIFVLITFILIAFGCGGGGGSDSGPGSSPVTNWKGVTCQNGDYFLEKIMNTAFGLPKQISMLPDGRIVISDPNNNRIVMIDGDQVKVLESSKELFPHAVVALPDGDVCCSYFNGNIWSIDPDTLRKKIIGQLPDGVGPWALACDENGAIYAAASDRSVYKINRRNRSKVVDNLPFVNITDIEIADDNTIYVAGYERVVASKDGRVKTIVDGLQFEPVWIEVSPNGILYINETSQGLQSFDPYDQTLTNIRPDSFWPFGDIMSPNPGEIIFWNFDVFFEIKPVCGPYRTPLRSLGIDVAQDMGLAGSFFKLGVTLQLIINLGNDSVTKMISMYL